ncbi:hypothetical protein [Paraclostridium sordellii]|uniref:hypothetical protein n=2 Tax=Paraclostridium sordellii TaxID=1505 RepID=UPI0022E70418|nr:hypothetical protein [Paeniclostridium sordellii]
MFNWEIKKLLKNKSIIISGIILVLLCTMMSFIKPDLETENSYIDNKGNYIQDTREKSVIANSKLDDKVNQLKSLQINNNKNVDILSKSMSDMAKEKLKNDEGKEYKDINFYKVFNFRASNIFSGFIIVGICIYIFSGIYTDEKLSNVDSIILSSKNKYKALFSKLNLAIIMPILIYLMYLIVVGVITYTQYGQPLNGNLQAYRIVDVVAVLKPMTINSYTAINIMTMIIIFVSISIFSSLFSFISKNSVESIVSITIFLVIGKLLTLVKFLPRDLLSVITYSNYIDLFMNPQMFIGNYMGNIQIFGQNLGIISLGYVSLIFILLIGILANIYVFKKFLNR